MDEDESQYHCSVFGFQQCRPPGATGLNMALILLWHVPHHMGGANEGLLKVAPDANPVPGPKSGQANDHSNPAFMGGGVPEPGKS